MGDQDICGTVRPGTLGYQRCVKAQGHPDGLHRSQDGGEWGTSVNDFDRSDVEAVADRAAVALGLDPEAVSVEMPKPTRAGRISLKASQLAALIDRLDWSPRAQEVHDLMSRGLTVDQALKIVDGGE